ncbi:MAG TPA: nitrogenase [Cyanobacteria bacterium UBA11159]|nr:nitrogenase [Cyanobacteria bacterium UBA11367]HBE60824.1 nitrogenase [Cyanobacteria bacterium UBA11366]HBR73336.1 nitrogenase [Cyanobacteria bacterium UBA11159]HBS68774.1 nitrogenase [Cyanobacteria bacterium UBA11153]HCA93660.1 nitrogenase [Cyanobacteria bacterium UBA9226]
MSHHNSYHSTIKTSAHQTLNSAQKQGFFDNRFDFLQPVRRWLDTIEVDNPRLARFLSKAIPSQCPFQRDIKLFGHLIARIPPLCKLNPLYEELVGLRFRALCYLVDCCGEDIQQYYV